MAYVKTVVTVIENGDEQELSFSNKIEALFFAEAIDDGFDVNLALRIAQSGVTFYMESNFPYNLIELYEGTRIAYETHQFDAGEEEHIIQDAIENTLPIYIG